MLMAHPTVLRNLVERYETLSARVAPRDLETADGGDGIDPQVERQLIDTVYTLCVSTGTREIGQALRAARAHIDRHTFTTIETTVEPLSGTAA